MIRVIFKYAISTQETQLLELPQASLPLSVGVQADQLVLWCLVYPEAPPVKRRVSVYATGFDDVHARSDEYVGTVQHDAMVWHIFMGPELPNESR